MDIHQNDGSIKLSRKMIQIICGTAIVIGTGLLVFAAMHKDSSSENSNNVKTEVSSDTSVSQRQEIAEEKQRMVAQLEAQENSSQLAQSLQAAKNQLQSLKVKIQAEFDQANANGRITDYELIKLNASKQSNDYLLSALSQQIQTLQQSLSADYSNNLEKLETSFCDLNPKITSDNDRTFCHSLFK